MPGDTETPPFGVAFLFYPVVPEVQIENCTMASLRSKARRCRGVSALAGLVTTMLAVANGADAGDDTFYDAFVNPPKEAAPHVWWHWMNGHIDAAEAEKDLEWLRATGIGGVQLFEAGLGPEAPPDRRVEYGTKLWVKALETSVRSAKTLGLEFAITTSPGWSATGGPWVRPADAMKKLVWSASQVTGGEPITVQLREPPAVAGPYQDIPVSVLGGNPGISEFYKDVVTLAVPVDTQPTPVFAIASSAPITEQQWMQDGRFWPAAELAAGDNDDAWLLFVAEEPVTVQAVTLGLPGRRGFGSPEPPHAELQYSSDGKVFQTIVDLPSTKSLVRSASFEPVRATHFRIRLSPSRKPGFMESLSYAPGAARLPLPRQARSFSVSEVEFHAGPRVHAVEEKAGFAPAPDYYAVATPATLGTTARLDEIVDVSVFVDERDVLSWEAPAGDWQILRFGFSLTGQENGPAPREGTGLEVDKLSGERVARYMDTYLSLYEDEEGALLDGISGLLSDSIESGAQNWTEGLPARFMAMHGYDPMRWLPTIAGIVIDGPDESDRFLWDFRDTISMLLTEAHYETIARITKSRGLTYYAEALEDHRPQLGNDLDMRASADVPMAAFWFFPPDREPKATYVADLKGAASVAHFYGKPVVAVEAMTTFGFPWAVGPAELKRAADRAFLAGGNRLMLHSSVHQAGGRNFTPGQSMVPLLGHYFNRNVAWADFAKYWVDYLARSQFLLQQGRYAADFAYFVGEEAPVTGLFGDEAPAAITAGYQYDFLSASMLGALAVQDRILVTPGGMRYRFLFLGGSSGIMTLATLRRVHALASEGAIVVGRRPYASPSLGDDQATFLELVEATWSMPGVIDAKTPDDVFQALGMTPGWQFSVRGDSGGAGLDALKRNLPDGELYFVVNTTNANTRATLSIPPTLLQPEIWDAVTGKRQRPENRTPVDGDVDIGLDLAPYQSVFVVLRDSLGGAPRQPGPTTPADAPLVLTFDTGWDVTFDANYGQVPARTIAELSPLNEDKAQDVRYYSGVTTYSSRITTSRQQLDAAGEALLQVRSVADIAEVTVNGCVAGSLWTPPYELDLKPYLEDGSNEVTIRVANLWANRLIGLAHDSRSVEGFPVGVYEAGAPLRPAGLIGPVSLKLAP